MKIQYEEGQMQTMGIILDRLEVRGVEQARLLVTLDNVLKKGKRVEDPKQERGEESYGDFDRTELLQPEKETDKPGNHSGKKQERIKQRSRGGQQTGGHHRKSECKKYI